MKLTDEQKQTIAPLLDAAIEAKDVAEDADRAYSRAVDKLRREVGAPADAVFDHFRMCFCAKNGNGKLEPI